VPLARGRSGRRSQGRSASRPRGFVDVSLRARARRASRTTRSSAGRRRRRPPRCRASAREEPEEDRAGDRHDPRARDGAATSQALDGGEHRDRGGDHAVAVEQRRAEHHERASSRSLPVVALAASSRERARGGRGCRPAPSLSARITNVRYFTVTTIAATRTIEREHPEHVVRRRRHVVLLSGLKHSFRRRAGSCRCRRRRRRARPAPRGHARGRGARRPAWGRGARKALKTSEEREGTLERALRAKEASACAAARSAWGGASHASPCVADAVGIGEWRSRS
jgi:hypothetical protein